MCNLTGNIFNLQRFSTSDGPGIRTVVFFKGCPLDCAWCHNPESKNTATEIFYTQENCIGCRACESACPKGRHRFLVGRHHFERNGCASCGNCTRRCPTNALEACGEAKTAEEILDVVLRDASFYEESGGGMTLSGGEPLMQYDFSLALLQLAKKHNIHTAIETCGYSNRDLAALNQYTDLWLYDIKLFPEDEHKKYTGVSNKNILKNLYFLDSIGAKIILRCPIIPDINLSREHFDRIAVLSGKLKNVAQIHLEPYHPLGLSKSKHLDKMQVFQNDKFLEPSAVSPLADELCAKVNTEVIII